MLCGERTEQMHLQEAHLLATVIEVLHSLLHAARDGAHGHDDTVSIRRAVVIKQMILPPGELADLTHILLHDVGEFIIIAVVGLSKLEIDIGIIHHRAHPGILRIQGIGTEAGQSVIIHHLGKITVFQGLHLLDLMAGAESVKEVQKRNAGLDGGQMRHAGQIHNLLHAARIEDGKAGLTAVHYIGMIAKNGEGVGADGTGCNMQHTGQTLAGNTVHRGDHQHEALRGGKAGGQRTGFQCAVASTAGTGLRLHLYQTDRLIKNVLLSFGRPLIGMLGHGRRRCNGINCCDLGKRICYICRGLVTIADLHDLTHSFSSSWALKTANPDRPVPNLFRNSTIYILPLSLDSSMRKRQFWNYS